MRITYRIAPNGREAGLQLSRLFDDLDDLTPLWGTIETRLRAHFDRVFATEGGAAGKKWARLSPDYMAWKSLAHPGKGILEATGQLRDSLTNQGGYNIARKTPNRLEFGTRDPKARYHQHGTRRMPARPFLRTNPATQIMLTKAVRAHIQEAIR